MWLGRARLRLDRGQPRRQAGAARGRARALLITSADQEVRAWRLASEDGEARLYVVSEGKKKTESAMLSLRRNRFEAALEKLHSGLPVKAGSGATTGCWRASAASSSASPPSPDTTRSRSRRRKPAPTRPPCASSAGRNTTRPTRARAPMCCAPAHVDWDIETVLRTYWRITDIRGDLQEPQIRARPAPDLAPARPAHRGPPADRRAGLPRRASDPYPAGRARHPQVLDIDPESMRTWVRITTHLRQTDGTLIVNRQDTRPAAEVAQISSAAGVDRAIHRTRTRLMS